MKKLKTAIVSILIAIVATAMGFTACSGGNETEKPKTLSAPEIVLNDDFSVSWEEVDNATAYVVNVNGDDLKAQEALTFGAFTAVNSYTVKVKAKNDETVSEYSDAVTYSVYGVTLGTGEGYELKGEQTVYGGKDYTFTLEPKGEGYSVDGVTVKVNGAPISATEGKYTVKNVASDLSITVEGVEKKTCTVTIPSGEGFTVTGEDEAVFGEDYSFTVAKAVGYEQSALTVKVNGEVVTEENGSYTVKNVKTALEITVEGAAKNRYAVTAPAESVAYTFNGNAEVVHGEDYSFTLEVKEGYDKTNFAVKVNGSEISAAADGKTYTVENVTSAIEIAVEGLNIKRYDVTFSSGEGYELLGDEQAEHGGNYTFTLTIKEGYTESIPIVKCNGEELVAEKDGKTFVLENVTSALEITVENVELNTYTVSVAAGEDFIVTGENQKTVTHGESVQFTIAAKDTSCVLQVFNGQEKVCGENGVYTIENVTANVTLIVKVYDITAQLLIEDSWKDYDGSTKTENADGSITLRGWNIGVSAAYIQKAIEAGYTHLRFDYTTVNHTDSTKQGVYMEGKGTAYQKCYQGAGSARFDLNELKKSDGSYAEIWIQGRNSESWGDAKDVSLTVTNPTLFKSTETAKWTKSSPKIYCAVEENGYIVIDTIYCGNDQHVLSSTEWWAKYANNAATGNVSQRTIILSGKYLYAGNNSRGAVWGRKGAIESVVGEAANTEIVTEYANNTTYAEGNTFYYGLEKEGVYALKVNEFVSNRNSWGGFAYTYVDENTFTVTLPVDGRVVNVNTQDYIAQGYTKVVITAGEYTGGGQIWVGNDKWGDGGYMHGLNSGASIELDLTKFTGDNPYLHIFCSGVQTTVTITYTFVK